MKTGIDLITEERERQIIEEGFTTTDDQRYVKSELTFAAVAYALTCEYDMHGLEDTSNEPPPVCWPWEGIQWKPKDRIRDLTKAGALIAAEIDRLKRADSMR